MADEQMPSTVATEQNMSTNAMGFGAGLAANDPDAKARLAEMQKVRTGDIFQTGIQGAALGMQAAQGQTNPLAAVVQAYAAGMQAPAQMYQQKQKQIESAVGAMPFGTVVPEAMNPDSPYNVLAGIPYELASKAIAGIATEVAKTNAQGEMNRKNSELAEAKKIADMKILPPDKQIDAVQNFNKMPQVQDFKKVDGEYQTIISMPDDIPGHTALLAKYIQMLSPTARLNEQTMEVTDPAGTIDKWTKGLAMKLKGQGLLDPEERKKVERVAGIFHAKAQAKYANLKDAYMETFKDTNLDFRLMGEEPETFTKDGQTVTGYLIGGQIWPIQ
jgi:hypothetical protein